MGFTANGANRGHGSWRIIFTIYSWRGLHFSEIKLDDQATGLCYILLYTAFWPILY